MGERPYVTYDQLLAAYRALGLDRKLLTSTAKVTVMEPDAVIVTRYLRDADGKFYLDGDDIARRDVWYRVVRHEPRSRRMHTRYPHSRRPR